jgi:hypothetical protein
MARRALTVPYEPEKADRDGGPWALALALDVIEADFGIFVKVVAECLTALGKPDVPQIAHWLGKRFPSESQALLSKKAKCALIVMLTHGCASASVVKKGVANGKAYAQTSGRLQQRFLRETAILGNQGSGSNSSASGLDGSGSSNVGIMDPLTFSSNAIEDDDSCGPLPVHYSFEVHRTLQRLRHPHFVHVCQRAFHGPGAAIAQALLQNGPSRKGSALREAAHILARNNAELTPRLPHHFTLPDYEGGPGADHSGGLARSSSSGEGSHAGASRGNRRRARSNSSASSNSSATTSHESGSGSGSGGGGDSSPYDAGADDGGGKLAEQDDRMLTREEFELAFEQVKSTWQRMVNEGYVVPAAGLSTFAFPRSERSAMWLRKPDAVPMIEEEEKTLKELSYWSAASAPTSSVSGLSLATDAISSASHGSAGSGMGLLDAAARQAAKIEAGIDGDDDGDDEDDSDSDSGSETETESVGGDGTLSGRKRARKASATKESAAKRRRKDSSDDDDSDSSGSSSDDSDSKRKNKKKAAKASAAKKGSTAAAGKKGASPKGGKKAATAGKDTAGAKKRKGRETKAAKVKKEIQELYSQVTKGHNVRIDDEDMAVWSFGTDAANRFLRNDLVRRYAEICIASATSTSSSSSSSSASSAAATELSRVASRALIALLYRSASSSESQGNHLLHTSILNERSESVSVSEIVRTLKEEYKEPSSSGNNGGNIYGRMTPSAGLGGGSRSQSPSMSGITEKSVFQALHALSKHSTAAVKEDTKSSSTSSFGGSSYGERKFYVPYRSVITHLQLGAIEEAVKEKNVIYGPHIVRLLLHKGALDEKQISDALMVPSKDARTGIFGLVSKGLIDIQEIPKRPDRHPQFTFYLYAAVST